MSGWWLPRCGRWRRRRLLPALNWGAANASQSEHTGMLISLNFRSFKVSKFGGKWTLIKKSLDKN